MKWTKSLKFRLVMTLMLLGLLTISIISFAIISNQREVIRFHAQDDLNALGDILVTNTLAALLFNDPVAARQTLASLRVRPGINQAAIYDRDGEIFARFQRDSGAETPQTRQIRQVQAQQKTIINENENGLNIFIPMISHGELVGLMYLNDDMADLRHQLLNLYKVVSLTAVVAFTISLVAMLWLVRLFTTPLNQLMSTIADINRNKNYQQRAPEASTYEFNQLAKSFNHMIDEVETRGVQLERINEELEQRVEARTEALESALEVANEANKAKAEFLAVVSHEVRTPLNGVIGFAELLKLYKFEKDAAETVAMLDESAQTLLQLLNQILDFSKLDASKVELEEQHLDIHSFMKSVIETNRAKAERKGIEISFNPEACHGSYLADPLRLRQILNNLIDNAIKFTDEGEVSVIVSEAKSADENWLNFEVNDSGVGISQDKLKSIFTPFAQADNSITRRYGGTGLGLAICARLINLMGGHYGVNSDKEKGTQFWFKVPLPHADIQKTDKQNVSDDTVKAKGEGNRVLLVEDNEVNQKVALGMLSNMGFKVDIVTNGLDAVSHSIDTEYDLILMDYHMPQMGGLDATKQIRDCGEAGANSSTPIIALTADVQSNVVNKFKRAGADDMLVKPFTLAQLDSCLNKWLKKVPHKMAELPVIDEDVLDEISAMSGEQNQVLMANIVEVYLQRSPSLIEQIKQSLTGDDAEQLFKAAHALKSSSANIGAARVSEIAHEIEKLGRNNQVDQAYPYIERLVESYEQAQLMLKGRFGAA
ncbi:ATP-binding protein [Methylophaga sp.]|uniref:ATP-binding protein n=1 Tax=Methylophaga sp. TaxID=2024840 RepID=UPI003F6A4FDB